MNDVLKLSYLLASKICHDLATPLGAISLGIDMAGDPAMDDMMRQSLEAANLKLKFYRTLLTPTESAPHLGEIAPYLKDFAASHNISLTFGSLDDEKLHGGLGRLMLGLSYIAMETLLKGGNLKIVYDNDILKIEASGPKCLLRDTYSEALMTQDLAMSSQNARTILPYYLLCIANLTDTRIVCDYQENVSLSLSLHPLTP